MNYKNIKEKEDFYTSILVESKSQLSNLINNLNSITNHIWRGSPNSLFENYTSLQRVNLSIKNQNTIDDVLIHIEQLIDKFDNWNNGLLVRYLNNYNIKEIPIFAKLSILRHFDVPTPLLDWTRNPFIALFFAIENVFQSNDEQDIEYFSLYCLTSDHPYYKNSFKEGLIEYIIDDASYLQKLGQRMEFISKHCDEEIQELTKIIFLKEYCQSEFTKKEFVFRIIKKLPILRIEDNVNDDFFFYIKDNYNITSQEGLFMLNLFPYLPLEKAIFARIRELEIKESSQQNAFKLCKSNFISYEISTKLIPLLRSLLNERGINQEYVFPNLNRLKEEIISNTR